MRRWAFIALAIGISIITTGVFWALGIVGAAFVVPWAFYAFSRRRRPAMACPSCGRRPDSADEAYCPYDGSRLSDGA